MKTQPLVSIIMPTFNREKILYKSINSVINQNYSNWELLVIDDMSTDNTKEYIEEYSKKEPRIKYLLNSRSKGVSGARNTGIENANGKYVAFLDSDDEWKPFHIEQSIAVLCLEDISVSFSYWFYKIKEDILESYLTTENEKNIISVVEELHAIKKKDYFIFNKNFFEYTLKTSFYCCDLNTLVIKNETLKKVGFFKEDMHIAEDDDLIYRIIEFNRFSLIRRPSYIYTIGNKDSLYAYIDRFSITEKIKYTDYNPQILDSSQIKKLTQKGLDDLKIVKNKLAYIKSSPNITNKSDCVKGVKTGAALRAFTLGYINRSQNKNIALYFYIKSLIFRMNKLPVIFIIKLANKKLFKNIKTIPISLW